MSRWEDELDGGRPESTGANVEEVGEVLRGEAADWLDGEEQLTGVI